MRLDPSQIPLPPSPAPTLESVSVPESFPLEDTHHSFIDTMSNPTETSSSDVGHSIKILEHDNYYQWSDMMLSYFLVHNLDGIVDGSEVPPSVPSKLNNWLLREKKAAGFIAMKLNSSNRDLFLTSENRRNPRAL